MDTLLQVLVAGLATGSIYAMVALGFALLVNAADIVNLAQGEFVMLGAYLVFTLVTVGRVPFWLALLLAPAAVALVGLAVERAAYRPLRHTNVVTIIISTLGVSLFLQNVALRIWGALPEYFGEPFGRAVLDVWGLRLLPQHLLILGMTGLLLLVQVYFFQHTRPGKLMRATAQDRNAARLLGINVERMTAMTFALAGGTGGLAGILLAPILFLTPDMGVMVGIKAFVSSIVGGWGSIPGAVAGGLIVGLVEVLAAAYVSSLYKDVFAFAVLVAFLVILPRGFFGERIGQKA